MPFCFYFYCLKTENQEMNDENARTKGNSTLFLIFSSTLQEKMIVREFLISLERLSGCDWFLNAHPPYKPQGLFFFFFSFCLFLSCMCVCTFFFLTYLLN